MPHSPPTVQSPWNLLPRCAVQRVSARRRQRSGHMGRPAPAPAPAPAPLSMFSFRWQFRLVSAPTRRSSSSMRMHISASSCTCCASSLSVSISGMLAARRTLSVTLTLTQDRGPWPRVPGRSSPPPPPGPRGPPPTPTCPRKSPGRARGGLAPRTQRKRAARPHSVPRPGRSTSGPLRAPDPHPRGPSRLPPAYHRWPRSGYVCSAARASCAARCSRRPRPQVWGPLLGAVRPIVSARARARHIVPGQSRAGRAWRHGRARACAGPRSRRLGSAVTGVL